MNVLPLANVSIKFSCIAFGLLSAFAAHAARSSCDGIAVDGEYVVIRTCSFEGEFLAPGEVMELRRVGDAENCTFTANATIKKTTVEYSITPPPGVLSGPYDMCALWSFDEGSRPGSFPRDMVEPCRIWRNRPPDRVVTTEVPLEKQFDSGDVVLDISARISSAGDCLLRRR